MASTDLMALAEDERVELRSLLSKLSPEQWESPSLCANWSVREVAAHIVSYDELSKTQTTVAFLRGRLSPSKVNDVVLQNYRDLPPEAILDVVSRCQRPRGLTAAMGGGIALTDGTIHQQDIRRALGIPRVIAEAQIVPVLDFALRAPTLPSRSNRRGLRLVATDVNWSSGKGPKVTGPAEALLLAVAGRTDPLPELAGAGLPTLAQRIT